MSWLVDNANLLYIVLGVIAAALVLVWWNNRQAKYLGFAAGVLVLIGLLWLLTCFHISDSVQLKNNVDAMAQAVRDGKVDDLFKHVSKDFRYKEMDREMVYVLAQGVMKANKINAVRVSNFKVLELSRENKLAKTWFRVNAEGDGGQQIFVTEADFVLEGDHWKLKAMRFYNPVVNQDREIDIPGLR